MSRCAVVALLLLPNLAAADEKPAAPNIVYVLCDDLGYGDVSCNNPKGKIATPHIDKLATQGMRFTDMHSGSSVCTPTRYGVLTGRYSWRSPLKSGVGWGWTRRLIEKDRITVASLLKKHGYHTACFGKWHLGMDWALKAGGVASQDRPDGLDGWKVDYTKKIANGPLSVGFDTYFGISASLDMPPYVWIEDDRVRGLPTVEKKWIRQGPAHKEFEAVDVLSTLATKAIRYIEGRAAAAKKGTPFFLYLPLASPHTPIVPAKEWQGRGKLNDYADFVAQTDDAIGRVVAAIDKAGLRDSTLVIVTSDNGCSPAADIAGMMKKGHTPSGPFRGHKADIFEGGHRIPFVARWPGKVKAGSTCDQLGWLGDLLATCAAIVGAKLPDDAGEDSASLLPALTGAAKKPIREAVVHHSVNGSFAIRQGKWKLILCAGSGGWSNPKPGSKAEKGLPRVQLYDLEKDVGERTNVQGREAEVVKRMARLLEKVVSEGRSTPGKAQKNTTPVVLRPGGGKKG